jgi:hypothetical protein
LRRGGRLTLPTIASARPPNHGGKQVEVTNFLEVQDVNAVNVPPSDDSCVPTKAQLIGFTAATPDCESGLFSLNLACQDEFGANARMCTSLEVIETVTIRTGLARGRRAEG